jgi:hypothetical protein
MSSDASPSAQRWLAGAAAAWPLIFAITVVGAAAGYILAPASSTIVGGEFTFSNTEDTIEATGTWQVAGTDGEPNATGIFCWFPANTCRVVVAEVVAEESGKRLKLIEKSFEIVQLSDQTLTARTTSADECQVETLHIDRIAQSATLSVAPSEISTCSNVPTFTAALGG